MYRALKPIYETTGQTGSDPYSGAFFKWFRVRWEYLGPATSMADAKARYGGHPVLESQ